MASKEPSLVKTVACADRRPRTQFCYEPAVNNKNIVKYVETKKGKKWHEMDITEKREANEIAASIMRAMSAPKNTR